MSLITKVQVSLMAIALILSSYPPVAVANGYQPQKDDSTTHTGKTGSSSR
ncbi:MAG: hypothetical protein HC857_06270 [Synechococcales cyanobacterium RU_4_20]|nr:hypothetical protein [Synechococcales cyanobacterium RU_4_20]NJR67236.1 hypothetical protein [Synechococcales cyanobacterium CRU_2_2]